MRALIAGAGDLPAAIAQAAETPPIVAAMEGFPPNDLRADMAFRIETLGTLINRLRERGVTEICLCGAIERPSVDLSEVDAATRPLLADLADALQKGDDGALRGVMALFENAGFTVRAAHEIAPALLPPSGLLTETRPYPNAEADARQGDLVSLQQGVEDLGQACVIRGGQVIAREDDRGTDVMLASLTEPTAEDLLDQIGDLLGSAADWLSNPPRDGILYKARKPEQDTRADLPVVGPDTIAAAARAGLAGVVVEAGGVMVLHEARVRSACAAEGLFFWVRER